jgi:multiple sugar transport system substrate-binding protein
MKQRRPIFVVFVILALTVFFADAGAESGLHVLTRDTSAIGGPAIRHGRSFEARTGTHVTVTQVPYAELYEQIMVGLVTGHLDFDVLLIPAAWVPDFAPYLDPLPPKLADSRDVADIVSVYRHALMRWQGRWLALTLDGDLHLGAYRRDLFEQPQAQAEFEKTYSRPLAPPRTWSEYRDIAAFFSNPAAENGGHVSGTLEAFARDGQRLEYLFSHAAAYTSHPNHPGAMFFDPDSMRPAIDNPGWVRALTEYLEMRRYAPPDAARLDSEAVRTRFAQGEAAMDIDWADTGVLASDPQRSRVSGKVGFFALPGSRQVWNHTTRQWDELPVARSVTFLAFGGWVGVVPADSPNSALAWDYLAWYASPSHSAQDMLDGTSGINPYRSSQLADPTPWRSLLGERQADDYLKVLRNSLTANEVVPDLRLPGYRAYMAALEAQLDRVMAGDTSPEQGLHAAARAWDALTDRLGRSVQRHHYRDAMGLETDGP